MAAVLDALASYVKKLIVEMVQEEATMLLGVSGEIYKLEENMENIKAFLADAERRHITDQAVQRWVSKLKSAMYDATDILDLCQLEADKRRETMGGSSWKGNVPGCFQPLLFRLRNPVFAHEIGSRIKDLNQRLDKIYKEADRFKFNIILGNIILGSHQDWRMLADAEHSSSLKTMSEFDETPIIGEKIERDTKELIQELITNHNSDIKVVSIFGMGGMGKTTLAQKIFNEETIQELFKVRIWLSITEHFDEAELLRVAIEQAAGVHVGYHDKTLLMRTLTNYLSTGRFLLVMDDVWSDEAWKHLLSVPVRNASHKHPGSSIIITTRVEDMARRMGCSYYQYYVTPLSQEDSWILLKTQLPLHQAVGIDTLKDVGMKIIRRCEGLPLAIKVIGGLLSTKEATQRAWEAVLNNTAWSLYGLPEELDNRIYLSYEDLSPQLKQCFLYCSLFPKGMIIQQSELIPMWISEGFIQPQCGSSSHDDQLEEIALDYYLELMKRNLIEPAYESSVTGHQCILHDVVRSFAEFMAREESFVVQDERAVGRSHSLVHRLSIGSNISVPKWHILLKHKSVRTLIINCRTNIKPGEFFSSLPSLRVLFIRGADCDRLVDSLYVLRHLRYLHLNGTDITRLPDDIHRMKFLQHIVLTGSGNFENLPSSITKLVHLRTLDISGSNVNVVPKGFGMLTNLRSLYGFPVHMDMDGDSGWCSLQEIGTLSQLRDLTLHGLENVPASLFAKMGKVSSKVHLNYLELRWSSRGSIGSRDEFEKQRAEEEVFEEMSAPYCIRHLWIEGYIGRCLPNWMMVPATADFKILRYLALIDLPCCTQLSDHLCQLPCLELLQIDNAPVIRRIGPEFQASSQAVGGVAAKSVAFQNLANLYLSDLCEWKEWDWEEHGNDVSADTVAMPALNILTIQNCKLSCLPPGLANSKRHALRELKLCGLTTIASIENFPSVVKLDVISCPKLKRISDLSRLYTIRIIRCLNLEVLEGVPRLDSLILEDANMETLPGYLVAAHPRFLKLACGEELYNVLIPGSSEWYKISHIGKRNIECCTTGDHK